MKLERHVWAIVYINNNFRESLDEDAKKMGIDDIKFIVPTVSVIKKQFRGKKFVEEVPLLFNYGFVRLPLSLAQSKDRLIELKRMVPGVYNWLWVNHDKFTDKKAIKVSTISFREILRIVNVSRNYSVYAEEDINNLEAGARIELRGYPFDGMAAEIVSINRKREEVQVNLELGTLGKHVTVAFSNVAYSVYQEFEEPAASDNTVEGMKFYSRKGIKVESWWDE